MSVVVERDLATYYCRDEFGNVDFRSWDVALLECDRCESAYVALYASRIGSTCSDLSPIHCQHCQGEIGRVYCATAPVVTEIEDGSDRITELDYEQNI
ncbi:MAG: hypothetical protein AAFY15_08810 [Cyanobacteria bacterium J06648_11]